MSDEPRFTEDLLAWLEAVDAVWADAGLSRVLRRRLGRDLEVSILEGLESGASEADFVGDPPAVVAADIAAANGVPVTRRVRDEPQRSSFLKTTLMGAAAGCIVAWLVVYNSPYLIPFDSAASWVFVYVIAFAIALAGPAVALRRRFPSEPRLHRLQALATAGMLGGASLAAVPCWALARAFNYPTMSVLTLPEIILGLAICAVVVDAAWRWGSSGHWATPRTQSVGMN